MTMRYWALVSKSTWETVIAWDASQYLSGHRDGAVTRRRGRLRYVARAVPGTCCEPGPTRTGQPLALRCSKGPKVPTQPMGRGGLILGASDLKSPAPGGWELLRDLRAVIFLSANRRHSIRAGRAGESTPWAGDGISALERDTAGPANDHTA